MKDSKTILSLVVVGLVLVGLIALFFSGGAPNWRFSLDPESSEPYGTKVTKELLGSAYGSDVLEVKRIEVIQKIAEDSLEAGNYVFLGKQPYFEVSEAQNLLEWVAKGNNAFVIAQKHSTFIYDALLEAQRLSTAKGEKVTPDLGEFFLDQIIRIDEFEKQEQEKELYYDEYEGYYQNYMDPLDKYGDPSEIMAYSNSQYLAYNLESPPLNIRDTILGKYGPENRKIYTFESFEGTDQSISPVVFGAIETEMTDGVNCLRFEYGEGVFFLHSNPLLFTNKFMLQRIQFEYIKNCFADLNDGPIYFDRENMRPSAEDSMDDSDQTILTVILKNPASRAAWYLLLAGTVIYFVFGARRKQRIIPVLKGNENTSLEFVETMGQLYLKNKDHAGLARMQVKLAKAFIRERFHLQTNYKTQAELNHLAEEIATRAQLDEAYTKSVLNRLPKIEKSRMIDKSELTELHKAFDEFYEKCK